MTHAWEPRRELSEEETSILELCKKQKLWGFFRLFRHVLLDAEICGELAALFRPSGRGPAPVAPERLALAMLLQVAFDVPDHEVPTLTAVDRRWQMVLDCLGATKPAFSQGTVYNFRERMREHGFMGRLLEKTVEQARLTRGFSHKRLRVLIDSSPLVGAGRVEDTFNLLGRAIVQLLEAAAKQAGKDTNALAVELQLSIVSSSSIKAALDVDWRKPTAKSEALNDLLAQFGRLKEWLRERFDEDALGSSPLAEYLQRVERIIEQDTEPDPEPPQGSGPGRSVSNGQAAPSRRIREGAIADRLISLSDPDMRYGRKSKSKVFPGYKRHIAIDADVPGLICEVEIAAANIREHEAAAPILERAEGQGYEVIELHVDRGYLPSEAVAQRRRNGARVVSKPPTPRWTEQFTKYDFEVDFEAATVTCPDGVSVPLKPGKKMSFPTSKCRQCPLRERCLSPKASRKQLTLHPEERWYREMADELSTSDGRAERRARIPVEHALGRIAAIQGPKARFRGRSKNQLDLERTAVVNNCYVLNVALEDREAARANTGRLSSREPWAPPVKFETRDATIRAPWRQPALSRACRALRNGPSGPIQIRI